MSKISNNKRRIMIYILLIVCIANVGVYVSRKLDKDFVNSFNYNITSVQREMDRVNDIIVLIGIYADELMNSTHLIQELESDSKIDLLNYIQYDAQNDLFHMDSLMETEYDLYDNISISGRGDIDFLENPGNLKTREIYFSIMLKDRMRIIGEMLGKSEWVYYTSKNEFIAIRSKNGFVPTSEYTYTDEILETEFFAETINQNNIKNKEVYWSRPYDDVSLDVGTLITASYPVDYNKQYTGVVSVDFTPMVLEKYVDNKYTVLVMDENGMIVYENLEGYNSNDGLIHFDDLDYKVNFIDIDIAEQDELNKIAGSKVLSHELEGTPYTIYQIYNKNDILIDMSTYILQVIIVIGLFTIINMNNDKFKIVKKEQEELAQIANYDTLTNIYNRRGFKVHINNLTDKNLISSATWIILDIDFFKSVNDTYGHDVGDSVLVELSKLLSDSITENEVLSRFGGEEFVILAINTPINEGLALAERLRKIVENNKFETVGKITVSIGVAECTIACNQNDCFKDADMALYKAKRSGRNVVYYSKGYEINSYSDK